MIATIRFNLDDPDDRMSHLRCLKSLDMALFLWDLQQIAVKEDCIDTETINTLFERYSITLDEITC